MQNERNLRGERKKGSKCERERKSEKLFKNLYREIKKNKLKSVEKGERKKE